MKVKVIEREVLNPLADTDTTKVEINPIPPNINQLSLIDNTKPHADLILDILGENIGSNNIIKIQKSAGAPANNEQIKAARADLSILAVGDCGSCSTWLVLDAIKLEKQGTPTISICSDIFAAYARQIAESYGAGDLRILEIKHPLAGQSKGSIRTKMARIIAEINDYSVKKKS